MLICPDVSPAEEHSFVIKSISLSLSFFLMEHTSSHFKTLIFYKYFHPNNPRGQSLAPITPASAKLLVLSFKILL